MRRIMLIVSYNGTNYGGWQRQENAMTIQEMLEENLYKITGQRTIVHGSGRTDSGVHALAQVAHFETTAKMPDDKFAFALNAGLPKDIRVLKSQEVGQDFHSRFSAKRKHYRYTINNSPIASALYSDFELHVHNDVNYENMSQAANYLEGEHDFACFMSAGSKVSSTVRTIYQSKITKQDNYIYYDVIGNGFLYNMVRIIAGTLLEIGKGKHPPEHMKAVLQNNSRTLAGATAPAHGLMLVEVEYDN